MDKACSLLTAGLVAGLFAAGNAAAAPGNQPGWTMARAGEGREVLARSASSCERPHARAEGRGYGYPSWWAYGYGFPYGYGYAYQGYGVAGDSLGAVTPGALGTSRYGWW